MALMPLSESQRALLLELARQSVKSGLAEAHPPAVSASPHPPLNRPGASFVTLHRHGKLRGCIGSLEARRPLRVDVAENAFAAAFRDPRFSPLRAEETTGLELQVSVLSPPTALRFSGQADLLSQLRVGSDGLILQERGRRSTFLPAVWETLPTAATFLEQLKCKAGLPADYWSETLKVWRYTTESFGAAYLR